MPVRAEHGQVGMRLLALLGLATVAIWAIPLVALRGDDATPSLADTASIAEGASGAVAPQQPAISGPVTAPAAPAGASAPGATGSGGLTDPVGAANDLSAQSLLNEAIRVAQVYYAEQGSYGSFTPEVAAQYDPSIVFTLGAPAPEMVSMSVTPTSAVLVTLVEGGGYLCAAATADVVSFGRVYALSPEQCQGGWS